MSLNQQSDKISVIIPTFRRRQSLERLLRSIKKQNCSHKGLEVIVIDDQSGENLDSLISEFEIGMRIRCMISNIKGRPGARNTGASEAEGDLLIFLDDDMELQPGFIDAHVKIHRKWPDCVASGRILPAQNVGSLWNTLLDERFALHEKHVAKSPEDLGFTSVFTGNFSVSRNIFWKIGGFDDVTFSYYGGEDFDFGVRCRKAGIKIVYTDFALTRHFETSLNRKDFLEKNRWAATSMIVLLNKHKNLVIDERELTGFPCPLPGIYKPKRKPWKAILWRALIISPFLEVGLAMAEPVWFYLNHNLGLKIARICSTFYYQRFLCTATKTMWHRPRTED